MENNNDNKGLSLYFSLMSKPQVKNILKELRLDPDCLNHMRAMHVFKDFVM